MPGSLPDYSIGALGLNLVASPLHTPDGSLLVAENVEFRRDDEGIGGIASRRGLAAQNGSALAGSVKELANVPLAYPNIQHLAVGLNGDDTTNGWKESVDGVTFNNILNALLFRPAGLANVLPSGLNATVIFASPRIASYKNGLYYASDDYVQGTTAPPIVKFDGTNAWTQFRIPANPSVAGSLCLAVQDMIVADGLIYLAVWDSGGSAPNLKGRVLSYDPSTGTLRQIGNRFGQDTGENGKGRPFCLCKAYGYLWCGTYGQGGNNQGGMYRIVPDLDVSWTLDLTATIHNGYFMSCAEYHGTLYAATDADASGTAIIQKRSGTGAWTTTQTAPVANNGYFSCLFVFNDLLFAHFYKSTDNKSIIYSFDGTTWSSDLDVHATYAAAKGPGFPFTFGGAMYWAFLGSDSLTSATGTLLKRTTAGAWTQPIAAGAVRGPLGYYVP
jgi:hypothetical protein